MALLLMTPIGTQDGDGRRAAEELWRWVCRIIGALLLGGLVLEQGFKGPVALYILFAGLMTLGDVIAEAMRIRREMQELRGNDDDR